MITREASIVPPVCSKDEAAYYKSLAVPATRLMLANPHSDAKEAADRAGWSWRERPRSAVATHMKLVFFAHLRDVSRPIEMIRSARV